MYAFPLYLALYIVWPYSQKCRFMTPFVPLFSLALAVAISKFAGRTWLAKIMVVMVPLSIITSLVYLAKDFSDARKKDAHWMSIDAVCRKVPVAETPGSLLASRDLNLMFRVSLNKPIPLIAGNTNLAPDLHWILAETNTAVPAHFSPVFSQGQFVLLQRSPAPTGNRGP
jgi:hypothetical protein